MKKNRIAALGLAAAMTATLCTGALAAGDEDIMLISANPEAVTTVTSSAPNRYAAQLFLNGTELDTSAIPGVSGSDLIPMRLLAENDHGSASWFKEDNQGFFYLGDARIIVNFADNSVEVDGEKVEGVTATVTAGVTFLPASVVAGLEGFEVDLNPEMDVNRIDVSTPNGTPMMKLAYEILEASQCGAKMKGQLDWFLENYQVDPANAAEGVLFQGMNISPDCLMMVKVAEGGDKAAVKDALEQYRASQEETFSWYLSQNLPKVQAAKVIENGDYVMLLIAEEPEAGIELFNAFAAAQ